jgi:hypothetical protein
MPERIPAASPGLDELLPQSVAERACAWVKAQWAEFEVPSGLEDHEALSALKPLNELAFVSDVVLRVRPPGDEWASFARRALGFCWEQTAAGARLAGLLSRYPDRFDLTTFYASLARHGWHSDRLHELIAHLFQTTGIARLEVLPWVALDTAESLRALGIAPPRSTEALAERTWLYARPEPWTLSESAAFSAAHTVFHVTNFGLERPRLREDVAGYLEKWLPVWLSYLGRRGNFELLAELLIVDSCLGGCGDTDAGWETLHRAQHESGLVPAITHGVGHTLAGRQYSSTHRSEFKDNYHSSLVAMLAGAMASAPSTRP